MAFLGIRGTEDFVANERPEDWLEMLLYLYPNGQAPLTALMSMASSDDTTDPHFHWWTKIFPDQGGDIDGVYDDSGLSSGHTAGSGSDGDTVYLDVSADTQSEFRVGHTVLIRVKEDYRHDTLAQVTALGDSGGDAYLQVELLEDEDATHDIANGTADWVEVAGNSNQEGATFPDAISYDPTEHSNYTQIFRTPLKITRTALQTRYRTGDKYQEEKRETLELHGVEIEKAITWGEKELDTSGDQPERRTRGIAKAVIDYGPSENTSRYTSDPDFTGQSWLQGGKPWLDKRLEIIFRYGDQEKMALCGGKFLLAVAQLAEAYSGYDLEPMETDFGMSFQRLITPQGNVLFKQHPQWTRNPVTNRDALILEPRRLTLRPIQDTMFKEDDITSVRNGSKDALEEEFLTEVGLQYEHLETMGYLSGAGLDA